MADEIKGEGTSSEEYDRQIERFASFCASITYAGDVRPKPAPADDDEGND